MSYRALPGPLVVRRLRESGHVRLVVGGELDLFSAPTLRVELDALVTAGASVVVVDLEHVRLLDSSALATLLAVQQQLTRRGGALRLVNVAASARRVIEITGLERAFGLDGSSSRGEPMVATG